jgi:hypothetical protein
MTPATKLDSQHESLIRDYLCNKAEYLRYAMGPAGQELKTSDFERGGLSRISTEENPPGEIGDDLDADLRYDHRL